MCILLHFFKGLFENYGNITPLDATRIRCHCSAERRMLRASMLRRMRSKLPLPLIGALFCPLDLVVTRQTLPLFYLDIKPFYISYLIATIISLQNYCKPVAKNDTPLHYFCRKIKNLTINQRRIYYEKTFTCFIILCGIHFND